MSKHRNESTMYLGHLHDGHGHVFENMSIPLPQTYCQNLSSSHRRNKRGTYSDGGPWNLVVEDTILKPTSINTGIAGGSYYTGKLVCTPVGASIPVPSTNSAKIRNPAELEGAHAWANARKRLTKPEFSFVEPVIELKDFKLGALSSAKSLRNLLENPTARWKDLIPGYRELVSEVAEFINDKVRNLKRDPNGRFRLPGGRSVTKKSAEYYLAVQFGWVPLWNDVARFIRAAHNAGCKAEQLIKRNRREQYVTGVLHNESLSATEPVPGALGLILPHLHAFHFGSETASVTSTRRSLTWYKGTFVYALPQRNTTLPKYRKKLESALYRGWLPTPSDAYNLTPWSWMLDYFTETGDLFDAISSGVEDNLVAIGFWVMKTIESLDTTVVRGTYYGPGGSEHTFSTETDYIVKMKSRSQASPFGFGLASDSLNGFQKSILASLAITRA